MKAGPLDLSSDAFREAAGRVVDEATRYLDRLDGVPIRPASTGAQTLELFAGPGPETGLGAAALDDLVAVAEHSRAGNGRRASSSPTGGASATKSSSNHPFGISRGLLLGILSLGSRLSRGGPTNCRNRLAKSPGRRLTSLELPGCYRRRRAHQRWKHGAGERPARRNHRRLDGHGEADGE